ncbi:hypothetical protein ACFX2C_002668 [Malus domestica]
MAILISLSPQETKLCKAPIKAADVSSLFRVLSGYSDDQHLSVGSDSSGEKSTALITRNLLGGSGSSSSKFPNDSQELDLDLQVPNGWEKLGLRRNN